MAKREVVGLRETWWVWPDQYEAALADPEVLKLRGSRPVIQQLEALWPEAKTE